MKRFTSHYPISKLICEVFTDSKLKPREFVLKLGYRNVNNGVARLDQWLKDGAGAAFFLKKLIENYGISEEEIRSALAKTEAVKKKEAAAEDLRLEEYREKNFKPYIYIETYNIIPRQIFNFVISGGRAKFIRLPAAFLDLERERAVRIVSWLIRRHYKRRNGECQFFGPIEAYRFVRTFEENILFDTAGRLLKVQHSRFRVPFDIEFVFRRRKPTLR